MFEFLMSDEQRKLRDEVRGFISSIPRQYILDVHADKIKYPKEFLRECGRRNLLGLRVPKEYGGRGLKWEDDIIATEELGVPGYIFSCVAGVTGDVVTEPCCYTGTKNRKRNI